MNDKPISVLFVCLGNICRSPLAQGVFEAQALLHGDEHRFIDDSAGTSGWHIGDPPDPRSIETAARNGIDISAQRARLVSTDDLARFDAVLGMDANNLAAINRLGQGPALQARLLDFAEMGHAGRNGDVPDPYYGGASGFDDVYELLSEAMPRVIARLTETVPGR